MAESYSKAGVNLEAGYESVRLIKKHISRTARLGMMGNIGSFGGMFDLSLLNMKEPVLVSGTRRWGNRKLEDNWRISNKQQISFEDMEVMNNPNAAQDTVEYDEDGNPIPKRETDPKKPAFYTQDLPLTQAAMDSSNAMVVEALYNCALIYMDQLNDMKRANETLKKLIERYPDHDLALSSIYLLYLNYGKMNDQQQSDYYKNIILTQYANTDYARLISDPTYYIRMEEKAKEHERKYDIAYDYYTQKNWIYLPP